MTQTTHTYTTPNRRLVAVVGAFKFTAPRDEPLRCITIWYEGDWMDHVHRDGIDTEEKLREFAVDWVVTRTPGWTREAPAR